MSATDVPAGDEAPGSAAAAGDAAPTWVTDEGFDAEAGGRVRGTLLLVPCLLFAFGWCVPAVLAACVAPGFVRRRARSIARGWGRTLLWLFGIRLDEHGTELVDRTRPAIILFNHQSLLDLCILSACWPEHAAVLYKQEFHDVPIIGRTLRAMGMIAIDRKNRERAVESLRTAARRIADEGSQVFVAPEGTRSDQPGMLAFKRGPFHLALQTKAPLVLMVMRGVRSVLPHGAVVPRTGRIRVDYVGPVDTSDWTSATLDERMREVRGRFLQIVPPAPGTEPEAG